MHVAWRRLLVWGLIRDPASLHISQESSQPVPGTGVIRARATISRDRGALSRSCAILGAQATAARMSRETVAAQDDRSFR
jgi:hypothetical protein